MSSAAKKASDEMNTAADAARNMNKSMGEGAVDLGPASFGIMDSEQAMKAAANLLSEVTNLRDKGKELANTDITPKMDQSATDGIGQMVLGIEEFKRSLTGLDAVQRQILGSLRSNLTSAPEGEQPKIGIDGLAEQLTEFQQVAAKTVNFQNYLAGGFTLVGGEAEKAAAAFATLLKMLSDLGKAQKQTASALPDFDTSPIIDVTDQVEELGKETEQATQRVAKLSKQLKDLNIKSVDSLPIKGAKMGPKEPTDEERAAIEKMESP